VRRGRRRVEVGGWREGRGGEEGGVTATNSQIPVLMTLEPEQLVR